MCLVTMSCSQTVIVLNVSIYCVTCIYFAVSVCLVTMSCSQTVIVLNVFYLLCYMYILRCIDVPGDNFLFADCYSPQCFLSIVLHVYSSLYQCAW